ncbi:MAG: DUF6644 family protein [Acidobacteriota bacterium]
MALDFLNESPLVFPVLECFHIAGFIVAVGTIAIVDFRLLGFGLLRQDPEELARDLAPWTIVALGVTFMAGMGLYMSDPDMYYLNYIFLWKMAALLAALLFHYTLRGRMLRSSGSLAAIISIALWSFVIGGGIFTAFV